ncbi:MAG: leucine-rich repeat protein [Paludibacteraceae bacterium]|nr:leucine-rich repeat protein [Paludibacteraceae bacterium]
MLLPLGSMAQSLEIVEEFKENKMSTVLTTYKNEFGHREKQHVMDNKFPYAVLEVYLEGDEQAVKAAKSKLSLDLGSHFTVEGVCKTYNNRIVFLISSSVRNVYMTCGDGCKEQVIFSGQTLEQNKIYYGRVKYTPAKMATISGSPESTKRQYFSFQVTPANATVQVLEDGQWKLWEKEDGVFSKSLYYGTYSYKVYADRFQTEEGTIELNDTCKEKVVKLLPDYGWLTIESSSVSKGASVFITSKQISEPKFIGTIPLKDKELDKGEYVLQVQQSKYKNYVQNIIIQPNKTTTLTPELSPNFVSITLSTDSESEIYVDGKQYAKGSWIGTLELGEYSIEARKQYHRSVVKIVHITDNHANQTIEIDSPQPIYGSLHVKGTPSKASVYVDGKLVGNSPLIVNDLLIGEHEVRVEKDGCTVWKKTVKIAENEECIATYELEKGVSLERIILKGMNATNLSVKRDGDETLLLTYDLPKKGPVRLRMSTDGYTYTTQKNVQGDVGKEMDKGKQYQIAWTIPKDLGRAMQDSLYFQIVALPEFPKGEIKIGSLYYEAIDGGTSVAVVRPPYKKEKGTYKRIEYKFKKIAIPAEISYKGYKYSVTSIEYNAFYDCRNLTSITIPNSVTSIGSRAFDDCRNLTSITIPNCVTSIGSWAFSATPWYENYAKGKDVVYIGKVLYDCNNANLSTVVVREGTTSITSYAFSGCKSLQSISIPNSVRYIDYTALKECSSLAKITIDDGNPWLDSRDNCNAIIETKTNKIIVGCKNTTIPNSVKSIGQYAFKGCDKLTSITIPNSVTSIGDDAFYGCDNLAEIHLPAGMEDKFNKMEGIKDFYEERDKKYSDGWNYYFGINGVKQDNTKAISYFRIAATQGHADAQNFLGVCYYYGDGVDKNYVEAIKWYRKATEQGHSSAQNNLGNCYYNGEGVEQNYAEAVKWFRKAAEQGEKYAQYNLGVCYQYGNGVTKNLTEAKKWYQKAADQGHENAKKKLKELQ